MNLLLIHTPVGHLGTGDGGGVELSILLLANSLAKRGHVVSILTSEKSKLPSDAHALNLIELPGELAIPQQVGESYTIPPTGLVAEMSRFIVDEGARFDAIISFAYEEELLKCSSFCGGRLYHYLTMSSVSATFNEQLIRVLEQNPGTVGVFTRAQAATYPIDLQDLRILGAGFDFARFPLREERRPEKPRLLWTGRISREKDLLFALRVAEKVELPLTVLGKTQDKAYFHEVLKKDQKSLIRYGGFLKGQKYLDEITAHDVLLVTHEWVEALSNCVIEAQACGIPVVSIKRGGPAEIVENGRTGFLIAEKNERAFAEKIALTQSMRPKACRENVEKKYPLDQWVDRIEGWVT